MSWTQERTETARKLWIEGKSASEIAKAIGDVSRNAVIGKMHRIGAAGPGSPNRQVTFRPRAYKEPRPRKQRVSRSRPDDGFSFGSFKARPRLGIAGKGMVFEKPKGRKPRTEPPVPPADIALAPRHWETRRFGECAFPISGEGADVQSCCNKTAKTYCDEHQRRMSAKVVGAWAEFDKPTFARKVA